MMLDQELGNRCQIVGNDTPANQTFHAKSEVTKIKQVKTTLPTRIESWKSCLSQGKAPINRG